MAQSSTAPSAGERPFVISRQFDARRELVWRAHTEAERMREWWAPAGFANFACKIDARPGGICHYGLRAPDRQEMWGKLAYREVIAPERIVCVMSFSDPAGGITRHPMSPSWPLEMLSTTTLAAQGEKTLATVSWQPTNATEAERQTFDAGFEAMRQGFTGTFDQLAAYLARA